MPEIRLILTQDFHETLFGLLESGGCLPLRPIVSILAWKHLPYMRRSEKNLSLLSKILQLECGRKARYELRDYRIMDKKFKEMKSWWL